MQQALRDQIKHLNLNGFDELYRVLLLNSFSLPTIRIEPTVRILQATKEGLRISYEILSYFGHSEQLSQIESFGHLHEVASAWTDQYRPSEDESPPRPYIAALLLMEVVKAAHALDDENNHVKPDEIYQHGLSAGVLTMALKYEVSGLSEALGVMEIIRDHQQASREKAKDGAAKSALIRKRQADAWKSKALEAAQRLEPKSRKLSREQFADAIYREVGLNVGARSILNWLKDEAEEPNGILKKRGREGII